MSKQSKHGLASKETVSRVFLCLEDLLAFYGQMAPGRDAILAPGHPPVTYGALWARANDTVRALRSHGVGRSDRVVVVLPNGPETVVAMIGVAVCAVCVPLNPGFTANEWQRYLGDLQVSALLTGADMDSASRGVAHTLGIPVIDLSPRPNDGPCAFDLVGPKTGRIVGGDFAPSGNDAFILLTSGTASRAKMVPLTHAAVCRSAYNVGATLALGPQDRLLNVLPLFHVHGLVSGVLAALAAGSGVVCTAGFDATAFFGWLKEFRPTWYTAVPAIHRAVLSVAGGAKQSALRCPLRLIRSASSPMPPEVMGGLEHLFGVPVIDTYGMTEAASQIAANPLGRPKPGSVGQPAGAEISIMDSEGRRLPTGRRGEIALRGPTITRGYDNDDAATTHAFRDGWFRTGDIGYLDEDGYLFLVGRIKDIINRGGQKVAPGEVEQVLLSHPDVVEAAAFSIFHKRLGEDVAAAVVLRQSANVSADGLRRFARHRLASFKVPGEIHFVPEIPRGPAGKIKRDELVAALSITLPRARAQREGKLVAPRSELERQLAETWTELLEVDQIGVDEDVFALGADSITVTQMLSRLHARFGVDFSFKDIFDAPTVASLAVRVESLQKIGVTPNSHGVELNIARGEEGGPNTVSIVQEQMLRIERELPGLPQFNLPFGYRLRGRLNIPALKRSLSEIARRHDSLRTRFAWLDGLPVARIAPSVDINPLLVENDLGDCAPTKDNQVKALVLKKVELEVEQEALTPFDMNCQPLFRARLWRLGPDDHVLLLMLHDIIVDGWSMGVFWEEVSEIYAAFAGARAAQLPEPAFQFSDFSCWQRRWSTSDAATRQLAYWKERLRDAISVFPANGGVEDAALTADHVPAHVSSDLVARLNALSQSQGATLFMTLLAGFKTLLLARSGRNDICVATAMANRSQLRMERVIGPFANTTVIRTRLGADLSFQEALSRVRESVLEALANQELAFEILAARLAEEDCLDPASLIQVFFVLQNASRRSLKLPNVAVRPFAHQEGRPVMPIDRTWLTLRLKETPSGITGTCSYKNDLFEPNTLQHWMADYKTILAKVAANHEMSLGRLADS